MRAREQVPAVAEYEGPERLPWRARRRLQKAHRRGRTGLLLVAEIREPIRAPVEKAGSVLLLEGGKELCYRSKFNRSPKFVEMATGVHDVEFVVVRNRVRKSSSFRRAFTLREGEIFVAICDPVQWNTFYRKSPLMDSWVIGISSGDDVS